MDYQHFVKYFEHCDKNNESLQFTADGGLVRTHIFHRCEEYFSWAIEYVKGDFRKTFIVALTDEELKLSPMERLDLFLARVEKRVEMCNRPPANFDF